MRGLMERRAFVSSMGAIAEIPGNPLVAECFLMADTLDL
jgi:hypothetical protein